MVGIKSILVGILFAWFLSRNSRKARRTHHSKQHIKLWFDFLFDGSEFEQLMIDRHGDSLRKNQRIYEMIQMGADLKKNKGDDGRLRSEAQFVFSCDFSKQSGLICREIDCQKKQITSKGSKIKFGLDSLYGKYGISAAPKFFMTESGILADNKGSIPNRGLTLPIGLIVARVAEWGPVESWTKVMRENLMKDLGPDVEIGSLFLGFDGSEWPGSFSEDLKWVFSSSPDDFGKGSLALKTKYMIVAICIDEVDKDNQPSH